jgi:hypothetical protein
MKFKVYVKKTHRNYSYTIFADCLRSAAMKVRKEHIDHNGFEIIPL